MKEQVNMLIMFYRNQGDDITYPWSKKNVDEIIANSAQTDKYRYKIYGQVRTGR